MVIKRNKKMISVTKQPGLFLPVIFFVLAFVVTVSFIYLLSTIKFGQSKSLVAGINKRLIIDYLSIEAEIFLDPYDLKKMIEEKEDDYVLVDVRSAKDYAKGHIIRSVNIPFQESKIPIDQYRKLSEKPIVIYGDSSQSQTVRQVAKSLWEKNIQVKILRVGWNEWRHTSNFWLKEADWGQFNVADYITEKN